MSFKKKLSLYVAVISAFIAYPALALAQGADAASNKFDTGGMIGLAAGIAIGIAALGGTLAQGRATAAALEGIARQPNAQSKIQTPMILGLALIESLVLFAFVIAFVLQGKIQLGG